MKKLGILVALCVGCAIVGWIAFRPHKLSRRTVKGSQSTNAIVSSVGKASRATGPSLSSRAMEITPTRSDRMKMSDEERLKLLERLGSVPADADSKDWAL